MTGTRFTIGSLVKARGREWVVLPGSEEDLLLLKPLGGTEAEVTGIYLPLEPVEPARFDLPDPNLAGGHRSARLLREAVRLSSRAGAGPFRSFARIAVEPRPYQLVPLLMALKLDPVRILISDDVGIGKSVEAGLIVRELLDRGEVEGLGVLCPPHLAEQWRKELRDKFHIDAELVLPSTAGKLERDCRVGQSLFEIHPFVVVSMDFIKTDRRRLEFVRTAPKLLVIDEAHTCAFGYEGRGGRHQRHELVKQLADSDRHLILVTATPHCGKEQAFRSLLSFLKPEFKELPEDLAGKQNEAHRRRLAEHFVQRRRADIRKYLDTSTFFPERKEAEESYKLSPEYRNLFDRVLRYARETVIDPVGGKHRQRVRWWSALALLRSLASSPAAAAATLRTRSTTVETETPEEADEAGRRTVFDVDSEDREEGVDVAPGSDPTRSEDAEAEKTRRRLLDMAREAEALEGEKDLKILKAADLVKTLLKDGHRPILFCRFIPTAEYVAQELGKRLPKDAVVLPVTGLLPPAEREARVLSLKDHPKRVLIATDCLSEGINLQEHFDAVLHYDLSWSPTRHEQREGRVDRFGQPRPVVKVLTYYGIDNQIDGIVIDVLIRKHKTIRSSLGISVPVPIDTNAVVEAIFEGLLLREKGASEEGPRQGLLPGFEEYLRPKKEDLYTHWERAADREKRSRTVFAQESIKVEEVARELEASRNAVGSAVDVAAFVEDSLQAHGAVLARKEDFTQFDLKETARALRDSLRCDERFAARYDLPLKEGQVHLSRTHPIVEGLATHVLDTALDPAAESVARRAAAIRTRTVAKRTTLLLLRFRYDIITKHGRDRRSQLAEECRLLAFTGPPEDAVWLDEKAAEGLLWAAPDANIGGEQAAGFIWKVVEGYEALRPKVEGEARSRAAALKDAHARVRVSAHLPGLACEVEPQLPADLLGIYVFLPAGGARA